MRTTRMAFDDSCAGVKIGNRKYKADDHIVEMPESDAKKLIDSGMPTAVRSIGGGLGWTPAYEDVWDRCFGSKESA